MEVGLSSNGSSSINIPVDSLREHFSILGNTGSGKTVMAKIILEECILKGIPAIVIDVQGDLARLALDPEESENLDASKVKEWKNKSEVRIWTPGDDAGLPISLDPFKVPPPELDEEDAILAWDAMASGIASILGFDALKPREMAVKSFLYRLLVEMAEDNKTPADFGDLGKALGSIDPMDYQDLINQSRIKEMERRANALNSGMKNRLYNFGAPMSIPMMLEPVKAGRVPLNVLYLNTLSDESMKAAFIQQFSRELYDWMLMNPSDLPQLLVFLDEAANYIPSGSRMPPTKSAIRQQLREARKYGVCWMLASQSPRDLDYKTFGQTNTLFLGRFKSSQDKREVKNLLREMQTDDSIAEETSGFKSGEFLILRSGQSEDGPERFNSRWLLTSHGPPLTAQDLPNLVSPETREWANSFVRSDAKRVKVPRSVSLSAKPSRALKNNVSTPKSDTLGGFTHFASVNDPLHVMMGLTNLITAATLAYCILLIGGDWSKEDIAAPHVVSSMIVSSLMIGGLLLGLTLKNDSPLSSRLRRHARALEGSVLVWIWMLWALSLLGGFSLAGAKYPLVVSQTLLSAFFLVEYAHRLQLGRLVVVGDTLAEKVQTGLKGLPTLLTEAEIGGLELTSKQTFDRLRALLDVSTLVLLVIVFIDSTTAQSGIWRDGILRVLSLSIVVQSSYGLANHNRGKPR